MDPAFTNTNICQEKVSTSKYTRDQKKVNSEFVIFYGHRACGAARGGACEAGAFGEESRVKS